MFGFILFQTLNIKLNHNRAESETQKNRIIKKYCLSMNDKSCEHFSDYSTNKKHKKIKTDISRHIKCNSSIVYALFNNISLIVVSNNPISAHPTMMNQELLLPLP